MRMTISEWICYLNNKTLLLEEELKGLSIQIPNLFSGSEPPSANLGVNGDYYIQFEGGILYKKINSVWEVEGDITEEKVDGGII